MALCQMDFVEINQHSRFAVALPASEAAIETSASRAPLESRARTRFTILDILDIGFEFQSSDRGASVV
jgi:hypothetical protein